MMKLRIGKDFTVQWSIFRKTAEGREAYGLENKRLILRLQNAYRTEDLTDFTVSGNVVSWTFYGKDQKSLGSYNLILVENQGKRGMVTVDIVTAFTLVAHTEQESGNPEGDVTIQTVSLESNSVLLPVGEGGSGPVDEEFDPESENAIANKTVTQAFIAVSGVLDGKQNTITDLADIRSNAAKGATALQSVPAEYVTEAELNDKGFATTAQVAQKQDIISDLATIRSNASKGATALQSVPNEYVTESELSAKGYATTSQVNAKQDKINDLADIRTGASKGATAIQEVKTINGQSIVGSGNIEIKGGSDVDTSDFATKEELNDKQDKINDLDAIRSGAAKGATALQSVPAEYVTETELNIKVAGKQDALVSGSNIKTINGQSIIGSGNITIEGGGDTSNLATKQELATEIGLIEAQIAGVSASIPTKVSQLNNDSKFIGESQYNTEIYNINQRINSVEQQISSVSSSVPTKVSQLNNDSGFATESYVLERVRTSIITALNTEI